MGIITRMRKQTAVYWAPRAERDVYGRLQFEDPVEVDCRWEDVSEEFVDQNGARQVSRARVYVDRDMEIGSLLMLGELTDELSNLQDPHTYDGVWSVRSFQKTPNLRNTETLRMALV